MKTDFARSSLTVRQLPQETEEQRRSMSLRQTEGCIYLQLLLNCFQYGLSAPGVRMVHEKRQGTAAETSTASTSTKETEKKKRVSGSLSQLIVQVLEACNSRKGISLAALKKALIEAGYNLTKSNVRLKRELRNLVSNGVVIRVTGSGVSGSFKFGKNQPPKTKKAAVKRVKGKKEPKKTRKKQPAVHKPKGLQGRKPSNAGRKRQVNKRPAGKAR